MQYKNWRFCCGKSFFFSGEKTENFVGKICNGPDEDGDYEVNFMRQSEKIKHGFQFPEKVDIASVQLNDIVKLRVLPKPASVATTKRLCVVFNFACDLSLFMHCSCVEY